MTSRNNDISGSSERSADKTAIGWSDENLIIASKPFDEMEKTDSDQLEQALTEQTLGSGDDTPKPLSYCDDNKLASSTKAQSISKISSDMIRRSFTRKKTLNMSNGAKRPSHPAILSANSLSNLLEEDLTQVLEQNSVHSANFTDAHQANIKSNNNEMATNEKNDGKKVDACIKNNSLHKVEEGIEDIRGGEGSSSSKINESSAITRNSFSKYNSDEIKTVKSCYNREGKLRQSSSVLNLLESQEDVPSNDQLNALGSLRAEECIEQCISNVIGKEKWDSIAQYAKRDLLVGQYLGKGTFSEVFEVIATVEVELPMLQRLSADKETLGKMMGAKFQDGSNISNSDSKDEGDRASPADEEDDLDREIDGMFGPSLDQGLVSVMEHGDEQQQPDEKYEQERELNRQNSSKEGAPNVCAGEKRFRKPAKGKDVEYTGAPKIVRQSQSVPSRGQRALSKSVSFGTCTNELHTQKQNVDFERLAKQKVDESDEKPTPSQSQSQPNNIRGKGRHHKSVCLGTHNRRTSEKQTRKLIVAMKCLKPQLRSDVDQFLIGVEDLVQETAMLASLDHPNIVKLHGRAAGSVSKSFKLTDGYFILLDRLEDTLEDRIIRWNKTFSRRAPPSLKQINVACSIANAVSYLHSKKILFRDLKPENVGFDSTGVVKLFDFGFAIGLNKPSSDSDDSVCSQLLYDRAGTPRYMAPEVGLEQGYGLPADVYSFGVLLWEICGLKKPFDEMKSAKDLYKNVFEGGMRPKLPKHWPHVLTELIAACWSKQPMGRPAIAHVCSILVEHAHDLSTGQHGGQDDHSKRMRMGSIVKSFKALPSVSTVTMPGFTSRNDSRSTSFAESHDNKTEDAGNGGEHAEVKSLEDSASLKSVDEHSAINASEEQTNEEASDDNIIIQNDISKNMEVSVTLLSLNGVVAKKKSVSNTTNKLKRWRNHKIEDNNKQVTIVASFYQDISGEEMFLTHVPSLPVKLTSAVSPNAASSSALECSDSLGGGNHSNGMLQPSIHWPSMDTNESARCHSLSTIQFKRNFVRETFSTNNHFLPQFYPIHLSVYRNGKLVPLGDVNLIINGEERGETSVTVPITTKVQATKLNPLDNPLRPAIAKCTQRKSKDTPMMKTKGDVFQFGLENDATLRILVKVHDSHASISEEQSVKKQQHQKSDKSICNNESSESSLYKLQESSEETNNVLQVKSIEDDNIMQKRYQEENEQLRAQLKNATQNAEALLKELDEAKAESESLPFYRTHLTELLNAIKKRKNEARCLKQKIEELQSLHKEEHVETLLFDENIDSVGKHGNEGSADDGILLIPFVDSRITAKEETYSHIEANFVMPESSREEFLSLLPVTNGRHGFNDEDYIGDVYMSGDSLPPSDFNSFSAGVTGMENLANSQKQTKENSPLGDSSPRFSKSLHSGFMKKSINGHHAAEFSPASTAYSSLDDSLTDSYIDLLYAIA
eukprot:CAMPEP_0183735070 /NCGR_PEP_ID=MMETSP0737-20130205/45562_1 /TAXON_ID=385413 /ORGANISM="Thalassiosira miniscula, Strain CCMP1093" /LENGTH=1451 /DNA_ID=CAMNT_0025968719 /DNA_START=307 /DNA_END=4662 /DNA_ORIENTATION=+